MTRNRNGLMIYDETWRMTAWTMAGALAAGASWLAYLRVFSETARDLSGWSAWTGPYRDVTPGAGDATTITLEAVEVEAPAPVAPEAAAAAAPAAGPDDLTRIKGVGPKLAEVLNGLGVTRYAQIAAWSAEDVAWFDDRLKFKGRIERDGWIGQARRLAEGGAGDDSAGGAGSAG